MKNPDEIKNGLEHCSTKKPCTSCPMWEECKEVSSLKPLWDNALAYIQQLESANAELLTKVKQLETECHQLERERDALVEAIRDEGRIYFTDARMPCRYCDAKGKYTGERCHYCHAKRPFGGFNWRGVKED